MTQYMVRDKELDVRDVTATDVADVARVHLAAWRAAYRGILSETLLERTGQADFERTWREILQRPERTDLAVWQDRRLRGYISFGPVDDRYGDSPATGEIYGLYVHPDHWAGGAAQQLLDEAIRQMQERGYAQAIVWTMRDFALARRFYTRNGFCLDGYGRAANSHGESFIEIRLSLELVNRANRRSGPATMLFKGER